MFLNSKIDAHLNSFQFTKTAQTHTLFLTFHKIKIKINIHSLKFKFKTQQHLWF